MTLEVLRQSGANTVAVIEGVKERLRDARGRSCPADVKLEVIRDQSRYIYEALHEIKTPPGARQHSGLPGGAAVHAQLARHGHRRRGHPRLGHRRRSA